MRFLAMMQVPAFFLAAFVLVFFAPTNASRPIPEAIITNFVSFPTENLPFFGNPDALVIGPDDGKLYVGFFGSFTDPTSVLKGVGRVSGDGSVELVSEFPMNSGFVEEMVFGSDSFLYVVSSGNSETTEFQNGIIRVDVADSDPHSNFEQFYANPDIGLATGLALDCRGNFYLADSNNGRIFKIDSEGNNVIKGVNQEGNQIPWLKDPLLDGNPAANNVGVDGMEFDNQARVIYAANFDQGSIVRIPVKRCGNPGKPSILVQDPALVSIDALGVSPDKQTLYGSVLFSGAIGQVDLRKEPVGLDFIVESGLGNIIQTIPANNFEKRSFRNSLFTSNLDVENIPGGNIWLISPDCPGNSRCTFYEGPINASHRRKKRCRLDQ